MESLNIFIGYDPREAVAYHVCANSIIRYSSKPVVFHPLALKNLKGYKETHNVESGKTGYPPTNQFIFSRFLVPYLMDFKGTAVFMDGDQVVTDDIAKLFDLADPYKAVQVVKHDYKTKFPIKYLGQKNEDYPRKNWSSVILWNCGHFANRTLIPSFVENSTGATLHRFAWLNDDQVGELPIEWGWLPDEYGPNPNAKLLHWTGGTPCFHDWALSPQAEIWHKERILTDMSIQIGIE